MFSGNAVGILRRSGRGLTSLWGTRLPVRFTSDIQRLKTETDRNGAHQLAEMTGVMEFLDLKEVLVFVDNIYPRWLAKLAYSKLWGPFLGKFKGTVNDERTKEQIMDVLNKEDSPLPDGSECKEYVALRRDGGAFLKFSIPPTSSASDLAASIEKNIQNVGYKQSILRLGSFAVHPPKALQVKGTPWIEDLSRFPSRRLKVIFEGESLSEEELYLLFRRYGTIVDIIPVSSSNSTATVIFKSTDACIRAKNCITGIRLNGGKTSLHLQYIPVLRVNHVTQFILNHQRIAVPIILALLATIAVLIFEPIRQYFILLKIRHYYTWEAHKNKWYMKLIYAPYRMIVSGLSDGRHFLDDSLNSITGSKKQAVEVDLVDSDTYWSERSDKANQLRLWVRENVNTFIVVKGPKGSAEREFVIDHALSIDEVFKKLLLELDCNSLVKARSEKAFLKATAAQLGYFPLFTWTNSISQFVDLGMQGLTGLKSGLSESEDTQFKNMLLLAQAAIRNVALADFGAYKNEFERQQQSKHNDTNNLDSDGLITSPKEEDYLQMHPEVKPVIVVNNFLNKSDSPHDFVYKALADWAGQLVQSNIAHVIFITLDSGSLSHLTAALPNQVLKAITLDDASDSSAKQYVTSQLSDTKWKNDIASCFEPLGGRMLDLQAFVRRVKSGEAPDVALDEMVKQASEQITTFFLNVGLSQSSADAPWNTAQLWALIRALVKSGSVDIDSLIESPLFALSSNTMSTLAVLEKNDLISLHREKGIIKKISTGRPLFKAAFEDLVSDVKVFKLYETCFFNELIAIENAKIAKLEDQLAKFTHAEIKNIDQRTQYLVLKINVSTDKVKDYEKLVKDIAAMDKSKKLSSFFGF